MTDFFVTIVLGLMVVVMVQIHNMTELTNQLKSK